VHCGFFAAQSSPSAVITARRSIPTPNGSASLQLAAYVVRRVERPMHLAQSNLLRRTAGFTRHIVLGLAAASSQLPVRAHPCYRPAVAKQRLSKPSDKSRHAARNAEL
jgi:hypothetical protein